MSHFSSLNSLSLVRQQSDLLLRISISDVLSGKELIGSNWSSCVRKSIILIPGGVELLVLWLARLPGDLQALGSLSGSSSSFIHIGALRKK